MRGGCFQNGCLGLKSRAFHAPGGGMIRILYSSQSSGLQMDFPLDKLKQALRNRKCLLWVDFNGEPDGVCEKILRETFKFHPLAVDDALQDTLLPKVDDWGDYLYIVLS